MALIHNPAFYRKKDIIFPGNWQGILRRYLSNTFHEMTSGEHYDEKVLQRVLLSQIRGYYKDLLFITYFNLKIKDKNGEGENHTPDFIAMKGDYSEWYIIEVELQFKDANHVGGQISTFKDGDYSDYKKIVSHMDNNLMDNEFDSERAEMLVRSQLPTIWLIADHINPEWLPVIRGKCITSTFQIYSDSHKNPMYRFAGSFPSVYMSKTICTIEKYTLSLIMQENILRNHPEINLGDEILVRYNGILDKWIYIEFKGMPALQYNGRYSNLDTSLNRFFLGRSFFGYFELENA